MPRLKITETAIGKMKAPDLSGKQTLHWDFELKGFAVLCSGVSNSKTYIVQRDIGGGRQRRITVGDARTLSLKEARHRGADMLDALRRGEDPKRKVEIATLRTTLTKYLQARKDLRPASIASYQLGVERYLLSWLDRPLSEITSDMVEERHRAIAVEIEQRRRGAAEKRHRDAPEASGGSFKFRGTATANGAMRAFRVLYNFAAERAKDLPINPVRRLRRQWFAEPRRTGYIHAEDMPKFYKGVLALENRVARDFILLILFTGMRRGEAASLTWNDIDLHHKVIRVPATRTKAGRKLDLPMSDVVSNLLEGRGALGREKYVFPANSKSGHIVESKFPLRQIYKATGIQISTHDLRRTYLTVAESSDISPLAMKALVNHSLGSDVTAGYVMMTAERLREPAQRVADRLKELCAFTRSSTLVA
jgi:integrase